jgi:hypothetical protein
MASTVVREYLVIVGGMGLAVWLIVSMVHQIGRHGAFPPTSGKLRPLEVVARLTFGSGLFLRQRPAPRSDRHRVELDGCLRRGGQHDLPRAQP